MSKKLKPKNKRGLFLVWASGFLTLTCSVMCVLYPSYMNINQVLHIFPFLPSTAHSTPALYSKNIATSTFHSKNIATSTFYGENIDMSQILPTSQYYIVNSKGQDLIDIAADLGINLMRITNAQRSFNNNADSVYTGKQWNQVLSKMQSKGIKAIILIEVDSNNGDYYAPDIRPAYLGLVQKYIDSDVFSNPAVYAVDIKNEPLLTDSNIGMLQAVHAMIKKKYPHLKQTIGGWATAEWPTDPYNPDGYLWLDFSAGQKIASIVDFYSVHMYGLDTDSYGVNLNPAMKAKVFLSQVENGLQTKKPILIGEFGEANGDAVSDQDTIGSPELQANIYQGVYQALKEMHSRQILGSVAFEFYSRNHYPDAWAIVKNKGDYLFPAAYILQEYASGKNNPSLQAATVVNSQSYLLKNADNYGIENLHVSDRIGFKIQLDSSTNYSISLSAKGTLRPLDFLHYNPASGSYYAVYQAVSKGRVQLNIMNDGKGTIARTPVYTVTLLIQ